MNARHLLSALLLSVYASAAAGYWTRTYSGGHSTIGGSQYPYTLSNGSWGGGGTAASGEITVVFTWQSQGDDPPDHVWVREWCSAGAMSDNYHAAPSASNGLDTDPIQTVTEPAPGWIQTSLNAIGSRLTYVVVGPGTSFSLTASPSASGFLTAAVHYKADILEQGVMVGFQGDETFHKGANDEQVSNYTLVASPKYGDTWVDPSDLIEAFQIPGYQDGTILYRVWPNFTCAKFGPWENPFHIWDTFNWHREDDLFHEVEDITPQWYLTEDELYALAQGGPLTRTITLRVVDNGGNGPIDETGYYKIRIHNKYENWRLDHQLPSLWYPVDNFQVALPGYAIAGGGIQCTWSEAGPMWAALQQALQATIAVTAEALKNPIFKAGFVAAGIALEQLGPHENNGVSQWAWNAPGSEIQGGDWNVDYHYYKMDPTLEIEYDAFLWWCDEYDEHGYSKVTPDVKAKPSGGYRWTGYFWRDNVDN